VEQSRSQNGSVAKFWRPLENRLNGDGVGHVTDKAPTYGIAISELKAEGKCPQETVHRQVKYLNNVVEADHGKLKQLIRPVRCFKTLTTAYVPSASVPVHSRRPSRSLGKHSNPNSLDGRGNAMSRATCVEA
jgi:transposase-like protein